MQVPGLGTMAFAAPFAAGYALHARRRAPDRALATGALALSVLELLGLAGMMVLWAWYLARL